MTPRAPSAGHTHRPWTAQAQPGAHTPGAAVQEGKASSTTTSSAFRPRPPNATPRPRLGAGPTRHPADATYAADDRVRLTTRIGDVDGGTCGVITRDADWPNIGPVHEVRVHTDHGRRWIWCTPNQLTPDVPRPRTTP